MRIIDADLLASAKHSTRCRWCGRPARAGSIVKHHILSRGAGGSDVPENLLDVDFECHGYLQERVPQDAQYRLLAYILRTTWEQLQAFNWALQALDKSASLADVQRLREQILNKGAA